MFIVTCPVRGASTPDFDPSFNDSSLRRLVSPRVRAPAVTAGTQQDHVPTISTAPVISSVKSQIVQQHPP